MPQINRIRVNNVKYNFGTQFYDDFIMRFSCKNTIYDLANGGGKSLLMLLLLQNLIPNCTLDEKQPIEKLFRQGGGNTCIHSLIEWKLDSCYRKDNYKYMTTGFCARKAKAGSNDVDGQMQLSNETLAVESVGGNSDNLNAGVEYFNYVIFYRGFGENDIRNLPLSKDGERVTYHGLKNYLRDLEKNDFGVSVKIFERKGDYQNFITQYGLFESEWEIVRGINKTEGHVRTYFETNYRTSRKVVEDLLIEEIIQKSFNNRLGVENDEGEMAKTLLDIKDKLVELSRKKSDMDCYDSQVEALDTFSGHVGVFTDIFEKKEKLQKQLFTMLIACRNNLKITNGEYQELLAKAKELDETIAQEQKLIGTAQVLQEQKSLEKVTASVESSSAAISRLKADYEKAKSDLSIKESANDYLDYQQYGKLRDEMKAAIDNRLRDHSDIIGELKALAQIRHDHDQKEAEKLADNISENQKLFENISLQVDKLTQQEREADRLAAVAKNNAEVYRVHIAQDESTLKELMNQTSLLVAENAQEEIAHQQELLSEAKADSAEAQLTIQKAEQNLENVRNEASHLVASCEMLGQEIETLSEKLKTQLQKQERFQKIAKVYNEADAENLQSGIADTYHKMEAQISSIQLEIKRQEQYIRNLESGHYELDGEQYNLVREYLERHLQEDVLTGQQWLETQDVEYRKDILRRVPFIQYGFVIKNDFERVRTDSALQNINDSSYIVPVISEEALKDNSVDMNAGYITYAGKKLDFLEDKGKTVSEIRVAEEEIQHLQLQRDKLTDRAALIWEDYEFVLTFTGLKEAGETVSEALVNEKNATLEKLESERKLKQSEVKTLVTTIETGRNQLNKCASIMAECEKSLLVLGRIQELHGKIQDQYRYVKEQQESEKTAQDQLAETTRNQQKTLRAKKELADKLNVLLESQKRAQAVWKDLFEEYYHPEEQESYREIYNRLAIQAGQFGTDGVESRFLGLKSVLEKETADISDKETLVATYQASMEKALGAITYRGFSLDQIQEKYEKNEITASRPEELLEIKNRLVEIEREMDAHDRDLDAQSALMNRIQGSIEHGRNQIIEKYGSFEEFELDNPDAYIEQHKAQLGKLCEDRKGLQTDTKTADKKVKDILVIEKDLQRIVANAGLTVPETDTIETQEQTDNQEWKHLEYTDISDYETVQKDFEKLLKLEYRRKDDFQKQKLVLTDQLNALGAVELASEVQANINTPQNMEEAKQLVANLRETNIYILLEKDRIAKGIEDMQKIKESFESRCIQTCCNIKSELDRLPKLSQITLDGEVISIIGLQIPYVKEELYRDRMSSYIDETVTGAESFKNPEERLKYIRNCLTWKKMFSVIVTDMNAIRINLYKRERMKDQSRYLRYEEAVGSTGQSQGIYIQFLIAIINYISSINALSHETTVLGKTIFIDNPFGAAKDIYIWEPIFKLLKTNHVQLIVPARGATPAITGRFDVNYILGQKLSGGRQQTVVVDYHSQVENEEMEFVPMNYEQGTLDIYE